MGHWHRVGPSCDWPAPGDWYEWYGLRCWAPARDPDEDRCIELGREGPRRGSRRVRGERDAAMRLKTLESRARKLRAELDRIETDIDRLAALPGEDVRS